MNLLQAPRQPSDVRGLFYADFNQDYGCFAVGLKSGFRIFNCDPLEETKRHGKYCCCHHYHTTRGIGTVSMLYRTNYIALIGGGSNPRFPLNTVIIWDDAKEKEVIRLEFRSEVKNVKLLRERMVIVLQDRVYVYTFSAQPKKLYMFETPHNDKGLVAVASSRSMSVLAFPGQQPGHIQVVDLGHMSNMLTNKLTIMAHTATLGYLAMSQNGQLIASASEKGTLIRVFDTQSGRILHEFRRGADRAAIYSIAFSADATRLCVASDKGTIHIFNLDASTLPASPTAARLSSDDATR
ncbi:WD40-repeat-containing domain protein [Syncephalis pseudoplumigaleata]|uniref:WD40-repeat-containing domain protein n=1 Tax=Syncephalis pseudoplumigaleata TaxID=1712513 RepID=A0A4P9Z3M0_9FUNG|nr:WD40-repeat-containing domain protein [Syncephalis pseudoplumigaleata]|eukprot:RKP26391.1 WD40-repeat-containing domain protein [Syncephalis pseudoplumigaleata]